MKTLNPYNDPQIGLSICCNAPTNTIPPSLGEPEFVICSHCNTETERVWKPIFEKVAQGTYRKIKYEIK
jgi:hypothetical protein